MDQRRSGYPVELKAVDVPAGIAEMYVSVFGNIDSAGEIVAPGFFAESIAANRRTDGTLRQKGMWSHDWDLPIAKTLDAKEVYPGDPALPESIRDLGGLWVKSQFNMETQRGREAFSDLQFGTADEFSIGYQVYQDSLDSTTGIRTLLKGNWLEWSVVFKGANDKTILLGTKAAPIVDDVETKALVGSFEDIAEDVLALAIPAIAALPDPDNDAAIYGVTTPANLHGYVVATYADHVIVCAYQDNDPDPEYWDVPYVIDGAGGGSDGEVTIGTPTLVELTYTVTPKSGPPILVKALAAHPVPVPLADQLARLQGDSGAIVDRLDRLHSLRAGERKVGQEFSAANRTRIGEYASWARDTGKTMAGHADAIDEMLARTAPSKALAAQLFASFLALELDDLTTNDGGK